MSCTMDYPAGVPSSPKDLLWHLGKVSGAEQVTFLDLQGVPKAHARDVPFSLCSCLSKKATESSTDPGGVPGFMFVHMQMLLRIVASLFYY